MWAATSYFIYHKVPIMLSDKSSYLTLILLSVSGVYSLWPRSRSLWYTYSHQNWLTAASYVDTDAWEISVPGTVVNSSPFKSQIIHTAPHHQSWFYLNIHRQRIYYYEVAFQHIHSRDYIILDSTHKLWHLSSIIQAFSLKFSVVLTRYRGDFMLWLVRGFLPDLFPLCLTLRLTIFFVTTHLKRHITKHLRCRVLHLINLSILRTGV